MRAEIGVLLIQAKESQRMSANHQKLGERHEAECPSPFSEGSNPAETFILDFLPPERETNPTFLLFKVPSLWYFVTMVLAN